MNMRVLLALLLVLLLVFAVTLAVAQDDAADDDAGDEGDDTKKDDEKPKFFFERGGDLKRADDEGADEDAEGGEAAKPGGGRRDIPAPGFGAAPEPAPADFDFEDEDMLRYWQAADGEAILDITAPEGAQAGGEGALRLTYMPREGAFQQLTASRLGGIKGDTLSFDIRTSTATPVSLGVVEQGGGFYQQFLETPTDEWVSVSIPLSSLVISQDTLAQDPGLKLDVAEIAEIRFQDLSNLGGAMGDALGRKVGVQQLILDNVRISEAEEPAPDAGMTVDTFESDAIAALAIGGAKLQKGEGAEGQCLEIVCEGRTQRWMGAVMVCGFLDIADAESLTLRAKASEALILSVNAEEWDGSKYEARLRLDPDDGWTDIEVPLDELLLVNDGDDENGKLDNQQIRVVVLVADMAGAEEFPITIGVDDIAFK